MLVLKFGGTSLSSAGRMKEVHRIVKATPGRKVVVLSAIAGTTDVLVKIADLFQKGQTDDVHRTLSELKEEYHEYLKQLFEEGSGMSAGKEVADRYFEEMTRLVSQPYYEQTAKIIVVMGELISTKLFALYLDAVGEDNLLVPAMDFMYLKPDGDPDIHIIKTRLTDILSREQDTQTVITQGFICRNANGGTDNLQRGGSDYSATLIGAALQVEEVQIWTDIDGMHNNDPRMVQNTVPISCLSFEEAGELAYFGAKILHPHCIIPAHAHNVPVRIKNTMKPQAEGTLITSNKNSNGVKAIAAKSGITAVKIKSSRMIMAYGFLRQVFEVFEKYKTPIDMITTSEVAISLTIDNPSSLDKIKSEIEVYGKVEIDRNQTIVCIVGDMIAEKKGMGSRIFHALEDIPIRMISYGGSRNNISLLVDSRFKKEALQALNRKLFKL